MSSKLDELSLELGDGVESTLELGDDFEESERPVEIFVARSVIVFPLVMSRTETCTKNALSTQFFYHIRTLI